MTLKGRMLKLVVTPLVLGLLFPGAWVVFAGNYSRTPVVEKSVMEHMTEHQRQEWIANNSNPIGLFERISDVPDLVSQHWVGYLEAAAGVFVFVFVLNGAFLLSVRRDS